MPAVLRRSPLAMVLLALLEEAAMHAYRMQQLIRERAQDSVVNVGSRNSVYQVLDRLQRHQLIAVAEDGGQGGKTVYEITGAGRETLYAWLGEMLGRPRNEYPEFPAALAFVALLTPARTAELLAERIAELDAVLAQPDPETVGKELGLPRVFLVEDEYKRAMATAERAWVAGLVADLRSGSLAWERPG
ncbi:PadR family transcriptional regulator [Nocardioides speluncae]|uniref:PadR family transcriptional regulator n=1 Tax=Nocardioides speluncae TaxID=2670337 RepID=UPI00198064CB|nr:PadR family transcriptional regulator [Nocardioides speluncae]